MHWFLPIFIIISLFSLKYNFWRPICNKEWPRILMYHNTNPNIENSGMNIKPKTFEKHLLYYQSKGYKFVKISELGEYNCVAITFDDGFESNYTHLFPILKKYNVPATIYLSPNLKTKGFTALSKAQIEEMHSSGLIEFGAHTLNHVNLLNVKNAVAEKEIIESKKYVESITKKTCKSFAYPYGRFNNTHIEILKKVGFESAVTTNKKIIPYNKNNLLTLPRLSMNGNLNRLELYLQRTRGKYKI